MFDIIAVLLLPAGIMLGYYQAHERHDAIIKCLERRVERTADRHELLEVLIKVIREERTVLLLSEDSEIRSLAESYRFDGFQGDVITLPDRKSRSK